MEQLATHFTDEGELRRREHFNKRWRLPENAKIPKQLVLQSSKMIQECYHLTRTYSRERLMFITLTFKSNAQAAEASRAFNDINRRLLPRFIETWIRVIDVHQNGRDHIHALGVAKDDVLAGTDLTKVRAFLDTVQNADSMNYDVPWSERRAMRDATSRNLHLAFMWAELDYSLTDYDFGWVYDAFPVIHPEAIPIYMRRAYLRARWHDIRYKLKNRNRVTYARNLRRKFPGGVVPRSQRSLRNEAALLAAFGLTDRKQFRDYIGKSGIYIVLCALPEALNFREPLDLLTSEDLAGRILSLCRSDLYFRSRLENLALRLEFVAAGQAGALREPQ